MGRRITILGMGDSAKERKHDILRYCEDTEIWGLNNGYCFYPGMRGHWARFFELHHWPYLRKWDAGPGVQCHFSELEALGCPVFTMEKLPVIKKQIDYPLLDVCRHLNNDNFFLGSPSLMLMLLLYEHDTQIDGKVEYVQSYGVDTKDPSHAQQRVSWAYWLHEVTDRGIDVGGTMASFMAVPENDKGLEGLREMVGKQLAKELEGGTESAP